MHAQPARPGPADRGRRARTSAASWPRRATWSCRYGGSLSGEHGDGQLRANQLVKMYGAELVRGFAEFKAVFDPDGRMNPGKVVAPYSPVQNLRLGTDYRPRPVRTHFAYPDDEKGFADAVNRCFGIGKCRHTEGGTMCPSFMVTREEKHSTRGRARLLFEMMSGHLRRRRLARPARQGGPGPVPVLQGLQGRLPGVGGHGHLQGRVPGPLLRAQAPAPAGLRARAHPRLGAAGLPRAGPGQRGDGRAAARLVWPNAPPGSNRAARRPRWPARPSATGSPRHQGPAEGTEVLLWPDTFTNYFTPEVGIAAVGSAGGGRLPGPDTGPVPVLRPPAL